jgi:hypothetical protein
MAFSWRSLFRTIADNRAECLTAFMWLAGWALLTAAIDMRSVWLASAGLLCMSLGGWQLLWTVLRLGLYTLTRGGGK